MLLDKRMFFIRERVAFLRLVDTYDILDPETKQQIGIAREEPALWLKLLRLLLKKAMLPTKVCVYEADGTSLVFTIVKSFTFFRSRVSVFDARGGYVGYFKNKIFSWGGGFWVFNAKDEQVAEIKGDWKGWNFRFIAAGEKELGRVTKKWAGIGKELFTTADNYIISIDEVVQGQPAVCLLLLAAGLAVDIIYKERG
ncbi:MAG: phospholipid scramblase-related protein [Candidatus Omnitrophota bacterium]